MISTLNHIWEQHVVNPVVIYVIAHVIQHVMHVALHARQLCAVCAVVVSHVTCYQKETLKLQLQIPRQSPCPFPFK